jgi:predicted ArsR family transcriptional regulator
MVDCFRHANHLQGEGEAVEHVHEEVLRNAGEGGFEVEEYNCPFPGCSMRPSCSESLCREHVSAFPAPDESLLRIRDELSHSRLNRDSDCTLQQGDYPC